MKPTYLWTDCMSVGLAYCLTSSAFSSDTCTPSSVSLNARKSNES